MIGKALSWLDRNLKEREGFPFNQIHLAVKGLRYLEDLMTESQNTALSRLYLNIRSYERRLMEGRYRLVTIDEAILWTYEWIKTFPCRYDLIVGIPRSGLLIGSIIAAKLAVPLSTPDSFSNGIYWPGCSKMTQEKIFSNIMIVDESVGTGDTMKKAYEVVRQHAPTAKITRAALMLIGNRLSAKSKKAFVDEYFKVVLSPVLVEWELLDNKYGTVAMDLDGVICEECPRGIDVNETKYLNWLRDAKPYLIPNYEVDYIISNRLERYRQETEEWLRRNGVLYRKLILWNLESKKERLGKFATHKIDVLTSVKPDFFFESEDSQAKAIWTATKIPTICTDKMILYS